MATKMHRVFICHTAKFTPQERKHVFERLNAPNVEIHELTYEEVEHVTFHTGDVAVIKPFEGPFYQTLHQNSNIRIYGPHAVSGPFESLPSNPRVYAQTLQPDGEERPLKVFIGTVESNYFAATCREQLEIMGAIIVNSVSHADIVLADKHDHRTAGADTVVSSSWINICYPAFLASDGCDVQTTRGYLLERRAFQGACVYFLMSTTLATIYRDGLISAGARVVDQLGPEVTHMIVSMKNARNYMDTIKQAWAMGVKVVDYAWANQSVADKGAQDEPYLVFESDFMPEPENELDDDAGFQPMDCATTPRPISRSRHAILSPQGASRRDARYTRAPSTPLQQPHLRQDGVAASPVQQARGAATAADQEKKLSTPEKRQNFRDNALQEYAEHEESAAIKYGELYDVAEPFLQSDLNYSHDASVDGDPNSQDVKKKLSYIRLGVTQRFQQIRHMKELCLTMAERARSLMGKDIIHTLYDDALIQRVDDAYRMFVADASKFVKDMEFVLEQDKEFKARVDAREAKGFHDRQQFKDILNLPMQHLVRQAFQVKTIREKLPKDDVNYVPLQAWEEKLKNICTKANNLTSNHESWHKVAALKLQIKNLATQTIRARDPCNKPVEYIDKMDVTFMANGAPGYIKGRLIFLSNVIILVTKRGMQLLQPSEYQYVTHIYLEHVTVLRGQTNEAALTLQSILDPEPKNKPASSEAESAQAAEPPASANPTTAATSRPLSALFRRNSSMRPPDPPADPAKPAAKPAKTTKEDEHDHKFQGRGLVVRFSSEERALAFQSKAGQVMRNTNIAIPLDMLDELEDHDSALRDQEMYRKPAAVPLRPHTPRPEGHRRRSMAFGNPKTYQGSSREAMMDTSFAGQPGQLERSGSMSSRRGSLMRAAGRAWKTLSRSGSRSNRKSKSRTKLDSEAAVDDVFAVPTPSHLAGRPDTGTPALRPRNMHRSDASTSSFKRQSLDDSQPSKRLNTMGSDKSRNQFRPAAINFDAKVEPEREFTSGY
eukprot:TRINITY_DN8440_c0_g1_i2.p1 TRINITY_DN8440_c0_g1~~TRINITY_DN8440_c0_g1_i2.p1  ORF type:complete len:1040 (+),score=251.64 TRINITY_DN8440_c0_g1_i2:112-3120(+)